MKLSDEDQFNLMIGRLNRNLSELIIAAETVDDQADRQTLKHHADDMIDAVKKILELLGED